jgi:DNA-binding transcriptional LysR family regulator
MWETVELRELRVFLALAEELHFGRTAARLSLTPSRVSQSLRALETKLGSQLVHRTSRRVQLTPRGERFYREAAAAHAQLIELLKRTHAANRRLEGTLRIGLFSGPAGGPHLLSIVGAFERHHPECHVEVGHVSWDEPFGQIHRGEIDLMATWLPPKQTDLVAGPILSREKRVLAVAPDHPLASRAHVSIEDLVDYRVPKYEGLPKEFHEVWVPSRTPSGRVIPVVRIPVGERTSLDLALKVARGELVHPTVPSIAAYMGDHDLVYVPIRDLPPLRSVLVWRRRATDPKLREFVRVASDVLRGTNASRTPSREPAPGSQRLAATGRGASARSRS